MHKTNFFQQNRYIVRRQGMHGNKLKYLEKFQDYCGPFCLKLTQKIRFPLANIFTSSQPLEKTFNNPVTAKASITIKGQETMTNCTKQPKK